MKKILFLLLVIPLTSTAQEFCFTGNLRDFMQERSLECKNLMLGNLSFINNSKSVYPVGKTNVLDSLASYLAVAPFIFEIDYETRDGKVDSDKDREMEEAVRNYLISKNQVNQVRVLPEAHKKIDRSAFIPKNMNAAFFFVIIYPSPLEMQH